MTDLKTLGMSDLIALYNTEATRTGKDPVTEFKTTKAAREAIEALRALPDASAASDAPFDGGTKVETEASGKPVLIPAGDGSKYVSTDKRGPNQGVGAYAKELILQGQDNATVLKNVAEKFPTAKTSKGCIAYYRTALRNAAKTEAAKTEAAKTAVPAGDAAAVVEGAAAAATAEPAVA